jgi:hypothetical protein
VLAAGTAIAPSVIAVLGTLGGAVVGGVLTLLVQRSNHRHEDRTRWHADRLRAYSGFIGAADAGFHSFTAGRAGADETMLQIYDAADAVSILGTSGVSKAAEAWIDALRLLVDEPSPDRLRPVVDRRADFVVAVRQELGVP